MANAHTYNKWKELGYQVKKGESAAYKLYGKSIFTRDQVTKGNEGKFEYKNTCFNCGRDVESSSDEQCGSCNWLICSCGACGCDFK